MNDANFGEVKIQAAHCYCCGDAFQKSGPHRKTMHHAIPRFLKPKRNLLLPICDKCHKEINKFTVQSVPKLDALNHFVNGMETFLQKYKKVMARYEVKNVKG